MEKHPRDDSPEAIQAEKALFSAIQSDNQSKLESQGILAKARAMLLESSLIAERTKAFVTLVGSTAVAEDNNVPTQVVPAIRFHTKVEDDELAEINIVRLADVDVNGNLIYGLGFSFDDVETVRGMLNDIQNRRDEGELPHINKHLTQILDPNDPRSHHPSNI